MTFAELQNEAQKIYKRARTEAERVESEKAHIREVYTPKIAAENCADEDKAFSSFVNDCADEFESKVRVCVLYWRRIIKLQRPCRLSQRKIMRVFICPISMTLKH